MKVLLVLCACVALASAGAPAKESEQRNKRLFISSFFNTVKEAASSAIDRVEGAAETVGGAIVDAAETAGGAIKDAAQSAGGAIVDAAGTVRDGVVSAANAVDDFVTDAASSVARAASQARTLLVPILNQVAATVGPVAEELGKAALQKLMENAPQLLEQLGQAALQEIVTSAVTSLGKRDVSNVDNVALLLRQLVEGQVNGSVAEVHRVLGGVEMFNEQLKSEVQTLQSALKSGQDPQAVAQTFLLNTASGVQRLVASNSHHLDLDHLDSLLHDSIQLFGKKLKQGLRTEVGRQQKRGLLLNIAQDVAGLIRAGEQAIDTVVQDLEQAAQTLLQPTVTNVKAIAQTLLNNAGSVSSQLMQQALTALAPFQQQLGPLFQQLSALGESLGLPHVSLSGLGLRKRGLLLNLAQDVIGLIQAGEQNLAASIENVKQIAEGLLAPTVDNVKAIAQTLLDNASALNAGLLQQAMTVLAPFQQQLGPLFLQLTTLAQSLGLPPIDQLIG